MARTFGYDQEKMFTPPLEQTQGALEKAVSSDEDDYEKVEFDYETPASEEELSGLRGKVEENIARKAVEMGITGEEELRELLRLAELDPDSLDGERLQDLKLKQGEVRFIDRSVEEALSKCWRSKTGQLIAQPANTEKIIQLTEFIERHHKVIDVFVLANYIASAGSAGFKNLAGAGVQVETEKGTVSLGDMVTPENIQKIDESGATGTPIDIMKLYAPPTQFQDKKTGFGFGFDIKTVEQKDNSVHKTVKLDNIFWNKQQQDKLNDDLAAIGMNMDNSGDGCSFEDFVDHQEKLIDIFSNDLGIDRGVMQSYFENILLPDTSQLKVVPYDQFKVNAATGSEENPLRLSEMKEKMYKQFNITRLDDGNWLKADKELDKWWSQQRGNSTDSFDQALAKEKDNYSQRPEAKLERLQVDERQTETYEHNAEFREMFLQDLKASGYSIEQLKAEAKKDPKRVFEIISEVIGKNVDYDWTEYMVIEAMVQADDLPEGTPGKEFIKEAGNNYLDDKYAAGEPYTALQTHKTVCHGYGKTFTAAFAYAQEILQQEGVPLGNVACLWTTSDAENHLWNALVTVDDSGHLTVTYIDPTWADEGAPLNAVDQDHFYGAVKEKIDREHAGALADIKEWNLETLQERLSDIVAQNDLTQYDPKSHRKEIRVQLNAQAFEAFERSKEADEEFMDKPHEEEYSDETISRIMNKIHGAERVQPPIARSEEPIPSPEEKERETQSLIARLRDKIKGRKKTE
jgi:hypothetical protein